MSFTSKRTKYRNSILKLQIILSMKYLKKMKYHRFFQFQIIPVCNAFFLFISLSLFVISYSLPIYFFPERESGLRNTYFSSGICSSLCRVVKRCKLGGGEKQFYLFIVILNLEDHSSDEFALCCFLLFSEA